MTLITINYKQLTNDYWLARFAATRLRYRATATDVSVVRWFRFGYQSVWAGEFYCVHFWQQTFVCASSLDHVNVVLFTRDDNMFGRIGFSIEGESRNKNAKINFTAKKKNQNQTIKHKYCPWHPTMDNMCRYIIILIHSSWPNNERTSSLIDVNSMGLGICSHFIAVCNVYGC